MTDEVTSLSATAERRVTILHLGVACFFMFGGILLIYLTAWRFKPEELNESLGSHFGVALFVAGSVGFGYELLHLRREFRDRVSELSDRVRELVIINAKEAEQHWPTVLSRRLGGDKADAVHLEVQNRITLIVDAINTLDREQWAASFVSAKSISVLLGYASRAADALAKAHPSGGQHTLFLPKTSASIADDILTEQLYALNDGDSYDVVSDFATWARGDIPKFWTATKKVLVAKAVTVRRVFVHFEYDSDLPLDKAYGALQKHWRLAETTRRNWIAALLGHSPRGGVIPRYQVGVCLNESNPRHVGIFRYGGRAVRFEPRSAGDLSEIDISRAEGNGLFDKLWPNAIKSWSVLSSGRHVHMSFTRGEAEIRRHEKDWFERRFAPTGKATTES